MQRQQKSDLRRQFFLFRNIVSASSLGDRASWLSVAALAALLVVSAAPAQQAQFAQGFAGAGQSANTRTPAETNAYLAAIRQPDPAVKLAALQQFLIDYPNSTLRQPAMAEKMMAERASHNAGSPAPGSPGPGSPPPGVINRAMPSQPVSTAAAPAPSVPAAAPPQTFGTPAKSLLQEAAKPAKVTIAQHSLTIVANNSALSQILQEISGSTGMKVDGLSQDQRIFGSYGPGDAREVLLALLQGSGYNVVMVGDTGSAPRELSLTQRATPTVASAQPSKTAAVEDDDDQDVQQTPPPPEPAQPPIVNQPPPGSVPTNPDGTPPHTPQEMQQDLLRMRQQQQQQQQ